MRKAAICLLALNMAVTGITALAAEDSSVIVTVNGEKILQEELDQMISTLSSRMAQYGNDLSEL